MAFLRRNMQGRSATPDCPMVASFLIIFVAFAACQALLTVTQADFLSPASDTGRASVKLAHDVGGAKLA
jgi:hypothetical protein